MANGRNKIYYLLTVFHPLVFCGWHTTGNSVSWLAKLHEWSRNNILLDNWDLHPVYSKTVMVSNSHKSIQINGSGVSLRALLYPQLWWVPNLRLPYCQPPASWRITESLAGASTCLKPTLSTAGKQKQKCVRHTGGVFETWQGTLAAMEEVVLVMENPKCSTNGGNTKEEKLYAYFFTPWRKTCKYKQGRDNFSSI